MISISKANFCLVCGDWVWATRSYSKVIDPWNPICPVPRSTRLYITHRTVKPRSYFKAVLVNLNSYSMWNVQLIKSFKQSDYALLCIKFPYGIIQRMCDEVCTCARKREWVCTFVYQWPSFHHQRVRELGGGGVQDKWDC